MMTRSDEYSRMAALGKLAILALIKFSRSISFCATNLGTRRETYGSLKNASSVLCWLSGFWHLSGGLKTQVTAPWAKIEPPFGPCGRGICYIRRLFFSNCYFLLHRNTGLCSHMMTDLMCFGPHEIVIDI